jgi:hypothetical protein
VEEIFDSKIGFYASNFAFYAANRCRHRNILDTLAAAALFILRTQFGALILGIAAPNDGDTVTSGTWMDRN